MPPENALALPFVTRDQLAFQGSSQFGLSITIMSTAEQPITIRGATREGIFVYRAVGGTLYTPTTTVFPLPDVPLWISVIDLDGNFEIGQCHARVSLTVNSDIIQELTAGWVTSNQSIAWPNTQQERPTQGRGQLISVSGANPAAGAEVSITVPSNTIWLVRAVRFTLVAAAAAASRRVHLVFTEKDGMAFDVLSPTDQIISETKTYSAVPGYAGGTATNDNDIIIPLPQDLILNPESTITTETFNINVGDNYGVPEVYVEQWPI